jgi:hypothetical protein
VLLLILGDNPQLISDALLMFSNALHHRSQLRSKLRQHFVALSKFSGEGSGSGHKHNWQHHNRTPFGSSTRRPPQPTMKSSAADRSSATARKPFCLIFTGTKPNDGPASSSSTGSKTLIPSGFEPPFCNLFDSSVLSVLSVVKCDRVFDHGLHGTHGFQGESHSHGVVRSRSI